MPRLTGLVRYLGADLLRSQRFLLPVFLYVLLLSPLFNGDPGPPPQLWTVTVLVLYPVSCWLGPGRVAVGVLVTCLLADAGLITVAVCWPMLSTGYGFPAPTVAATGTAVGLLCARPVIHGVGWSLVVGGGVLFLTATQTWLPPVGLTIRSVGEGSTGTLAMQAVLGLFLSALAAAVTVLVHNRR